MLKILQARLQQYENQELPDTAEFRKGRGTKDQIASVHWIIEKAKEFHFKTYFSISAGYFIFKYKIFHAKNVCTLQ